MPPGWHLASMQLTIRVRPRLATFAALLLVAFLATTARAALAATPLTVTQAIATQNGTSQSVTGYIVGEPVATATVNRTNFTGDLAIALADSASETGMSKMLYVQLTTQWRSAWGLQTNPSKLGTKVTVTFHDTWQHNRNPFIDHPEWVTSIWP
jgi:hypothetical protein